MEKLLILTAERIHRGFRDQGVTFTAEGCNLDQAERQVIVAPANEDQVELVARTAEWDRLIPCERCNRQVPS
jgi:hypothetical protein